ncbi:MAG: hypothetical protein GY950_01095 [bacterium]|nr:hypothetical protein [bacterium]
MTHYRKTFLIGALILFFIFGTFSCREKSEDISPVGDYRYLEGTYEAGKLHLSGI